MPTSDEPRQPTGSGRLSENEISCHTCGAVVKKGSYINHLASHSGKVGETGATTSSEPSGKTGLLAEYEEEKERDAHRPHSTGPLQVWNVASASTENVRGQGGKWTTCPRCAEEVKVVYMEQHRCHDDTLYVHAIPHLGITAAEFIVDLTEILQERPGMTAGNLTNALTRRFRRRVDISTVNSVLYTFADRRFRMVDSWPPTWYSMATK